MRCRTCEYSLWGIRERVCPECGSAFSPSEYEFRPRAVAFECPSCGQDYYGTGPRGALVPAAFACVRCGERCAMDEMVLRPAAGVDERDTDRSRTRNPWEHRKEIGRVRAWLRTVGASFVSPARLIRHTETDGSAPAALGFAVCTLVISSFLMISVVALLMIGLSAAGLGLPVLPATVVFLTVGVLGILLILLAWSVSAHVFFRATGGAGHGFRRSCQCVCYSSGVNMCSAVPLLGIYLAPVAWIWWGIAAMVMFRRGQNVSWGRAATAGLVPPILALGGVAATLVWLYSNALGAGGMNAWIYVRTETETMTAAVAASMRAGALGHASELIADGAITPGDFVISGSSTSAGAVMVGVTSLEELSGLDAIAQRRLAREASAALPDGVAAHRVGDFVFTYHGVDVSDAAHAGVWIVIASPDPDVDHGDAEWNGLWAGKADGSIDVLFTETMSYVLGAQNGLRESLGLPALPDPATVTHSAPVIGR